VEDFKDALRQWPIVIDYHIADDEFFNFLDGIYSSTVCANDQWNHAMGAIGFGVSDDGIEYAILKNSWGTEDWGVGGFIKVAMSNDDPMQSCGMLAVPLCSIRSSRSA